MKFEELPTPCFVVDEALIEHNLKILNGVMQRTGAKVILAQKAFSMTAMYPLIGKYLNGATASGLYEARLGYEEMGKENHVFAPAYREDEIDEILAICDHIIFNSFSQLEKFKDRALKAGDRLDFASIRNALHRKVTKSMIHAHQVRDSARSRRISVQSCSKACPVCTSIHYVSRTPTIWRQH